MYPPKFMEMYLKNVENSGTVFGEVMFKSIKLFFKFVWWFLFAVIFGLIVFIWSVFKIKTNKKFPTYGI